MDITVEKLEKAFTLWQNDYTAEQEEYDKYDMTTEGYAADAARSLMNYLERVNNGD